MEGLTINLIPRSPRTLRSRKVKVLGGSVDVFDTPKGYESSKTMTVTRMATATRLIPVTVGAADTPTRHACRRFCPNA